DQPSARVFAVTAIDAPLEQQATGSWWRQLIDRRMLCDDPVSSEVLQDVPALMLDCGLRNGGWPYLAMLARIDGQTYLADGIPAALPAMETTISALSGRAGPAATDAGPPTSAAIRRIEIELQSRLYGTGDLETYYKLMTLGQHYNGVKDYVTAERNYREALTIHERLQGVGNPETADPMMHLALELSNQERFVEADALFDRAGRLSVNAVDRADHARLLSYRAHHAANRGRADEAIRLAREATEIREALGQQRAVPGATVQASGAAAGPATSLRVTGDVLSVGELSNSSTDAVQSLYVEAMMLRRRGDIAGSEDRLARAQNLLASTGEAPPLWEPQVLKLASMVAGTRGAEAQAEATMGQAVVIFEERSPEQRPTAVAYLALGNTYARRGRLEEAMGAFRKGVELVRARQGRLRFSQIAAYLRAAHALAERNAERADSLYAEMFDAAQLVRSNATTRNIALASARLAQNEDRVGGLIRELQQNEDQRYLLERSYEAELARYLEPGHERRLEAINEDIVATNRRIQSLSGEVQAASPGYNQLVDKVTTLQSVIELLGQREALVQVLLGASGGFVFYVASGDVIAFPVDINQQQVARQVAELRVALEGPVAGDLVAFDVESSHALFEALFAPISAKMRAAEHLVTTASGSLLSFPFGLFVTEPAPPSISDHDYRQVAWLAKESAISLVPSARSFVDLRAVAGSSGAEQPFIGFGDFVPYSELAVEQTQSALPEECRREPERLQAHIESLQSLEALPLTARELDAVSAAFGATGAQLLTGLEFNEMSVTSNPLSDYRVVYFATHALLPSEAECAPKPALVASLPATPVETQDGLLDTDEILSLDLDADLVVLSACNTGGPGLESGGESLSGLARAFFYAGTRSLLVSHWPVENTATADMMVRMFEAIQRQPGLASAKALQQAQLSIVRDAGNADTWFRSHPWFWAAFTWVGDGNRTMTAGSSSQLRPQARPGIALRPIGPAKQSTPGNKV
ncbi:MAG: CHAT domain-containing tetratricopeptide repeat protein, partial [Gammaproteobacteria bacterium]